MQEITELCEDVKESTRIDGKNSKLADPYAIVKRRHATLTSEWKIDQLSEYRLVLRADTDIGVVYYNYFTGKVVDNEGRTVRCDRPSNQMFETYMQMLDKMTDPILVERDGNLALEKNETILLDKGRRIHYNKYTKEPIFGIKVALFPKAKKTLEELENEIVTDICCE